MKLEKLTKDQEEKMIQVKQYWLDYIFSCKNSIDRERAKISIDWLYKFCKLGSPIVIFVDSPIACQYAALYAKEWSKYLKMNRDQVRAQVGDQVNGPAISFKDGYSQYYVNGRTVPEEKYLKALSGKVTKDDWLQEKNEDIKAAWFEIIGSEKLIEVLGAEEIDSTVLVHANGEAEDLRFFKTPFSLPEIGEPLAWVKFICPSTGSNYLISVNPKHSKVMAAVTDTCPFFGFEIQSESDYSFNARG